MKFTSNYSKTWIDGDGSTTDIPVWYPYINKDTVYVTIEYSDTGLQVTDGSYSFEWLNDATIRITPAPAIGIRVWVERDSSTFMGEMVSFQDSANLTSADLEIAYRQAFYTAQEAVDLAAFLMLSKGSIQDTINACDAAAATATAKATAAALSATAAATSATSAAGSATAASAYATAAAASATSAAAAATLIVGGCLQAANNLSDLANTATARTNLGIPSTIGDMLKSDNLSGLPNYTTARSNLGLGTAALAALSSLLQAANNLSDVGSAATARTNLGLGTGNSPTFVGLTLSAAVVNSVAASNSAPAFQFGTSGTLGGIGLGTNGDLILFGAGNPVISMGTSGPTARSDAAYSWRSTTAYGSAVDLSVFRGAAGISQQRNGTNAQKAQFYKSFTDSSNGEWYEIDTTGTVFMLTSKANGTGTVRGLGLGVNGTLKWYAETANGDFFPNTDKALNLGGSSNRVQDAFIGRWIDGGSYREAVVNAAGFSAGTVTIDCSLGNTFTLSVTAAITAWTFTNIPSSGKAFDLRVVLISDGTSRAVASPAAWNWGDNTIYTTTNITSGKETHILASTRDGGTTWKVCPAGVY